MDPVTLSLLASGGGGLLNALFGSDDEFKMSPEQRRLLQQIMGDLGSGNYGPSATEQMGILKRIKEGLQEESQERTGSSMASLSRRGVLSPGTAAGMTTGIQSAYGREYGKATRDVPIWAADVKRQEKGRLQSLLAQLSQGQFVPGRDVGGIGDLAGNVGLLSYLKKYGSGQGDTGGFSNLDFSRYFKR